ncbi:MAG: hypothetical protein PHQ75_13675, partial [Thermoguttaceae bacterium]|nr:hypothetical protein [Thermoguttaceae bacterium]
MEFTRKIETGLLVLAVGVSTLCSLQGTTYATPPAPSQAAITQSPNQNGTEVPAAASDTLTRSQELLLKARHSLMSRDVNSALRLTQEAQALNAPYGDVNDRPEYVLPLIRQYQAIEQAARANGMTEKVKRDFARSYLDQAEALRRCRDFDNADSLVTEARKFNVYMDSQSIQKGMDYDAVAQRIRDDRTAVAARQSSQVPAQPLVGLSEAMKHQITDVQNQLVQARAMFASGQMDRAEELARHLQGRGIPENAYAGGDSPTKLLGDIATTRSQRNAQASQNNGAIRQVQGTELRPSLGKSNGYLYVKEAEAALRAGNKTAALKNFQGALRYASEMDAQTVRHVNESIAKLNVPAAAAPIASNAAKPAASNAKSPVSASPKAAPAEPVAPVASGINFKQSPQQVQSEISAYIAKTNQIRKTNPKEALAKLVTLRKELEASNLEASIKGHFSFSIDMAINETNKFITENGPMIELDNQNKDVEQQVRQKREEQLQVQQKLAEDVEKYNRLMEEGKYDEAIILAKKCQDYSHDSVVAIQMYQKARTKKQVAFNDHLKESRANGWLQGMNDVETASVINISDEKPVDFGPRWDIVKNRTAIDTGSIRSEADMEILDKLNVRITLPFDQPMPLATVMEFIGSTSQINVLIDNQALTDAGVTSDMAVETKLSNITLKNYLKHILEPYNLTYIVDDEVLKITSKN